jgi:hypothetical protein
MPIFTFFTEKDGSGPDVEQFSGSDIEAAVMNWYRKSRAKPAPYDPEGSGINAITGVLNVWCISGLDPLDLFYLVHIVGPLEDMRVLREKRSAPMYTFVTDKAGGTYIEQFEGVDLEDAVLRWHDQSHTTPGPYPPDGRILDPVSGIRGVWRICGARLDNRSYITHVVPTSILR